ncbi:hypothetical protein J3B02_005564, partial [Coemansia erecta]
MSSSYQRKAPWDRNTKYWCQYCQIFVHDNKSSRRMHETGAKHKENVQKYLRQIDKNVKEKQDAEAKLRSELDKIEEAAAESYSKDIGATESKATAGPELTKVAKAAKDTENEKQQQTVGRVQKSSRPDNIGVIGAWEAVQEPDSEPEPEADPELVVSRDKGGSVNQSEAEPSKTVFVETKHSNKDQEESSGFDIKEKTIESVQAHFKRELDSDEVFGADAATEAAGSL